MAKKADINVKLGVDGTPKLEKATKQTDKQTKALDRNAKASKRARAADKARYDHEKQAILQTAPAAKNFSKMSRSMDGGTGAGGLVRAYALLAANVFALSAAFGVLSRAAQVDTLMQSMEVLELQTGKSVRIIGQELQKVSGYGMDLAESMRATSLALSAGFDSTAIKELGEVARNAAVSLGRPMGDALDRIFRGVIKVEPELLDEIGLFVRVKDASAKYASELGVAASSLTEFEKRQAFAAEAIRQGQEKFEAFSDVETDPYSQLAAVFSDLAQSIMSLVNVPLKFLIQILTTSKTVLMGVFGLVAGLLLKKAIPAMGFFAVSAKEAAADAVKANADYVADLNLGVDKQRQAALDKNKIIKDQVKQERDILAKARKKGPDFAGQTGKGGKALQKANERLNTKNLQGQKKIEALKMKRDALDKSKRKVNEDAIIKAQASLDKEIAKEEKLLKIAKERRKIKKDFPDFVPDEGTVAHRKQIDLKTEEQRTQGMATAVSTAEFKGVKAGWKSLGEEADKLSEKAKKGEIKFNKWNKTTFKFKGAVQLATVGMQGLMASFMMWFQILLVLTPILKKVMEWFGMWNEEHLKFQEAQKKANELIDTFEKKLKASNQAMRDSVFGSKKRSDAMTASHVAIAETSKAILEQVEAWKELQEAGGAGASWEKFKKKLSQDDNVAKMFTTLMNEYISGDLANISQNQVDFIRKQIGESTAMVIEAGSPTIDEAEINRLLELRNELQNLSHNMKKVDKVTGMNKGRWDEFLGPTGRASVPAIIRTITDEINKQRQPLTRWNQAVAIANTLFKRMGAEGLEEFAKGSKDTAQASQALDSVFEGARDNVRAYYDSFITKGRLDKPLASISQAVDKLMDPKLDPVKRANDIAKIADRENEIFQLMSETNRVAFLATDDADERLKILKKQRQEYIGQQAAMIKMKSAVSALSNLEKHLAASAKKTKDLEMIKLHTQEKKLDLQLQEKQNNTIEFLSTKKLTKESHAQLLVDLAGLDTAEEKLALLDNQSLTWKDLADIQRHFNEEDIAALNKKVHAATEIHKAQLSNLKIIKKELDAKEKIRKLEEKQFTLLAQIERFRGRGTTQLNPQQTAMLMIDAERQRLKLAEKRARVEKAIIDSEMMILKMTNSTLEAEGKFRQWNLDNPLNQLNAETMNAAIDESATYLKDAIDMEFENAALEFGVKIRDQVQIGLNTAFSTGIKGFNDTDLGKLFKAMGSPEILATALGKEKAESNVKELKRIIEFTKAVFPEATAVIEEQERVIGMWQEKLDNINADVLQQQMNMIKSIMLDFSATMQETFGADGLLAATISEFTVSVVNMSMKMKDSPLFTESEEGLTKRAAEFGNSLAQVANAFSGLRQIAQAASAASVAAIEKQIEAEKNRDGKSKESLQKIKMMEAKKEEMKKKAFEQNKKMMMAEVVMNTALAIMKAVGQGGIFGIPFAAMFAAMGAAQLAIISKMQYTGGASQPPDADAAISLGKRDNRVDVSQRASAGELAYLRGDRGIGTTATGFQPMGGAAGLRKGYAEGGVVVGERGPEMIQPNSGFNIIPNDQLGGKPVNAHFTIHAIDAAGVEEVLLGQQGNIISMIRQAANDHGEEFIESVNTDHLIGGTPKSAGGVDY